MRIRDEIFNGIIWQPDFYFRRAGVVCGPGAQNPDSYVYHKTVCDGENGGKRRDAQLPFGSYEFAMAAILAIVVMHDAMGVRMETGRQGKVLNEMLEVFTNMGKQISAEARLKEFVGHTPLQVLMGAILGIIIAVIVMSV